MMVENGSAFSGWLIEELLWWRCKSAVAQSSVECSRAMKRYFGGAPSSLQALVGERNLPLIQNKIAQLKAHPQRPVHFVWTLDTLQGKRSFQNSLNLLEQAGEQWVMVQCIDVTEKIFSEQKTSNPQERASLSQVYERQNFLEEQNRIIQESYDKQSRFLAMLSHELRSPLLGVNSMINQLKAHCAEDGYMIERLRVVSITVEQMMFLVNDILTYSQTEYDAITLHPRRFSLNQTFDYVKQLTKSIAAEKGVFVSLVYFGESEWVYGDSIRLSQILINLIVNGIKFTRFGGVSVEVRQAEGGRFEVMVMDSGEGIAADKLKDIFDPFVQFKTEGATRTLGSGLGLSVVKQLIDLMGGEISVSSTVGVGTTFYFSLTLPIAESEPMGEVDAIVNRANQKGGAVAATGSQLKVQTVRSVAGVDFSETPFEGISSETRILIVDDSRINRMVLSGYLKELECEVVEAEDGLAAWRLLETGRFDVVFLDIQMPQMDGFEVMRKVRALKERGGASDLKAVFAVTAGGGDELMPEGETLDSLGFSAWLVKPINKPQIVALLQKTLGTESRVSRDGVSERVVEKSINPAGPSSLESTNQAENVPDVEHSISRQQDFSVIPGHFHSMLGEFYKEFSSNLIALESALLQEDRDEVKRLAHYMKGNCMVLQLEQWVAGLREVEHMALNEQSNEKFSDGVKARIRWLQTGLKELENSELIRHNTK
jgi:signal transduction histidine kinase/CheY-like chemotaxis protein/HPt (histidine-containing phosphotransfer) domain-containing protein